MFSVISAAFGSSFLFGYNIGVLNPTQNVRELKITIFHQKSVSESQNRLFIHTEHRVYTRCWFCCAIGDWTVDSPDQMPSQWRHTQRGWGWDERFVVRQAEWAPGSDHVHRQYRAKHFMGSAQQPGAGRLRDRCANEFLHCGPLWAVSSGDFTALRIWIDEKIWKN